jgi:hypothetical protein
VTRPLEHYFTIFDSSFLLQGLALHSSLQRHAGASHLWVVCGDREAEEALNRLSLPSVSILPLRELENADLLAVKPGRSRREYYWTLTPFGFDAVFRRSAEAARVTYLDADLFFFRSPDEILAELTESGKQILITEHAYAPEYDQTATSGRFCVQFLTFTSDERARAVREKWQQQCIEWCFAFPSEGRFGDQKYLDVWPENYDSLVHVYEKPKNTLAPWNAKQLIGPAGQDPIFFHFHGARLVSRRLVQLRGGYRIGRAARRFYSTYLAQLKMERDRMKAHGLAVRVQSPIRSPLDYLRILRSMIRRTIRFAWL